MSRETDKQAFARLYAEHSRALLGYALRRSASSEDAADVVADTMLVAWRRRRHVPEGRAARAWLFGVARRLLANQRRGNHRRSRLADRLRRELVDQLGPSPQAWVEADVVVGTALGCLSAMPGSSSVGGHQQNQVQWSKKSLRCWHRRTGRWSRSRPASGRWRRSWS